MSDTLNNSSTSDLIADINAALELQLNGFTASIQASSQWRLTAGQPFRIMAFGQFGIFVDDAHNVYLTDGDLNNDGRLDSAPNQLPRSLEDTGLNRMLGGPVGDQLLGGTGLDFMYGLGSTQNTVPDELIDRSGALFDSRGALAGEEWKAYAQSTDKVWYYGATNRNDVIHIDFVTEPGILQGHHLITRLTNNNGNFTFDAQVQLDFGATDAQGNLVWSPNDTFYGLAINGAREVTATTSLTAAARFSLSVDGGDAILVSVNPSPRDEASTIRDVVGDINQALQAAGLSGRVVAKANGARVALLRTSDSSSRNGSLAVQQADQVAENQLGLMAGTEATIGLIGSNGLSSLLPPEGAFQAIIVDALDGDDEVVVGPTVVKSVWTDAGRGDDKVTYVSGKPILIDQFDADSRNDSATSRDVLQSIAGVRRFVGLTIDNPADNDWYEFTLPSQAVTGSVLRITSISPLDRTTVGLFGALNATTTVRSTTVNDNGVMEIDLGD